MRKILKRILLIFGALCVFLFPNSPSFGLHIPEGSSCYVYPSPAYGNTAWAVYNMPASGNVQILIYNEAADLVAQVLDSKNPGVQQTPLDLFYYRSGVYICKIIFTFDSGVKQSLKYFKFVVIK